MDKVINVTLTIEELKDVAMVAAQEAALKGSNDPRGLYNKKCATLAVIKAFGFNEKFTAHNLNMGNGKWAKVKYSDVDSDLILMSKAFHNAHYVVFVRNGEDDRTFEIVGYFTHEQLENADNHKHFYGPRYVLNLNDIHSIDTFYDLIKKNEKKPAVEKANPWTNLNNFLKDEAQKVKAASRPKKKRVVNPKATDEVVAFIKSRNGKGINADILARHAKITRELAVKRLNAALKRKLISVDPASSRYDRWFFAV